MTNSSQAVADIQGGDDVASVAPVFYVVSRKKLAVLYIATLGMYGVYWFYKNWSNYKNCESNWFNPDRSIWPVMRGFFSVFFTHALFRAIKSYGHDKAAVNEWSHESHATKLVLTMIVSNVLDRMSYRSIGSPYSDLASLLILAPLLALLLNAQDMINVSCDDPDGKSNSRFTKGNYVWIVLGVIFWILAILGFVLPD